MSALGKGGMKLRNIKRTEILSVREQVINTLREAIINGQIKEGERLINSTLAKELGVSATPVREALRSLEREGLIRHDTYKEAIVVKIDEKFLTDYYVTRIFLECGAIELACRNKSDAGDLINCLADMTDIISREEYSEYADLNMQFHLILLEMSGNHRLENMMKELFVYSSVAKDVRLEDNVKVSYEEHKKIVDAVSAGDEKNAVRYMREHIERSMHDVISKL